MALPSFNIRTLVATVLLIVAFGILPLLLIIAAFLIVLRFILNSYIKLFKPDLVSLVGGGSGYFTFDDPYNKPDVTIGFYCIVDGDIAVDDCVNHIEKCYANNPYFDQVTCSVSTWLGFAVWKRRSNSKFNIRNHVKPLPSDSFDPYKNQGRDFLTESDIVQFIHSYVKTPFPKDTPPLDFSICRGVHLDGATKPSTVIVVRMHHIAGDALSILRLMYCNFDNGDVLRGEMDERLGKLLKSPKRPILSLLVQSIIFPFLGLYQLIFHLVNSFDINPWHGFTSPTRTQFNFANAQIATQDIHAVRKRHGDVSFFCVLLGALTGATRKYFLRHGLPVPEDIHFSCSLPTPSDPNILGNNISLVCITLPTGLDNGADVLKRIHGEHASLKGTRVPHLVRAGFLFLGLFPRKLVKILNRWRVTTGGTSSVIGPSAPISLMGKTVTRVGGNAYIPSSTAVYMWCVSYNKIAYISLGVSTDIMPEPGMVQEYAKYLEDEIGSLMQTGENVQSLSDLDASQSHSKID